VHREFIEETGLAIEILALLAVLSDVVLLPEEGVELHSVRIIYRVSIVGDQVGKTAGGGSDHAAWWSHEEAKHLQLMPFVDQVLTLYRGDAVATRLRKHPRRWPGRGRSGDRVDPEI
jgi:ADP-ribose pyrophosphatase YjhB (NUDIX family)